MTIWKNQFYTTYYAHFDKKILASDYRNFIPFGKYIVNNCFSKDKSIRILDMGCGIGGFLKVFQDHGYIHVEGFDTSRDSVLFANANGLDKVKEDDIFVAFKLFEQNTFDVVLFLDVLEHFKREEVIELLRETNRVLKTSGSVIIHAPNAEGIFGAKIRYSDITHELAFTESSLTQLTRYTGFTRFVCFEDKPIIHGIFSFIRRILWELISLVYRFVHLVETGSFKIRLTQNILFQAYKT